MVYISFKSEVTKALSRTRGLYQHWQQLTVDGVSFSKDEAQKTTAELRNSIRSIEWDLEDLEDTIGNTIVAVSSKEIDYCGYP